LQILWLPYANESPGVQMFLYALGLLISLTSTRTSVGKKSEHCGLARRNNNWHGGFTELGVGRGPWRLSSSTPLLKEGSARAGNLGYSKPICNQFLKTSEYWDATNSMGKFLQYLSILTIKKGILIFKLNFLCFCLCLLPLAVTSKVLVTTEKSLAPFALHPPFRYFLTLMRSPWIFSSLG